jgi:hypothetical protein
MHDDAVAEPPRRSASPDVGEAPAVGTEAVPKSGNGRPGR